MSSKSIQSLHLFLLVMVLVWISVVLEARTNNLTDVEIEEHMKRLNKPAIKTIMSDDGDIIDCVDIYKQPAFHHPLLKNHTIEMRPSFIPEVVEERNKSLGVPVLQTWQKRGGCPEGTIPIRRIRKADLLRAGSLENFGVMTSLSDCKVEVARAELHRGGPYSGAHGVITVWDLYVEPWEWSSNSVTVFNIHDSFLESGWAVSQLLFGDSRPRIFVNWMDTVRNVGCFNLACSGFVQVSSNIVLGAPIYPTSRYDGNQYDVKSVIYNDPGQKKWWALFQDTPIGYWPSMILNDFDSVPRVNWGGSVCNTQGRGFHTKTQMGNGHFPLEGYKKTGHLADMMVLDPKQRRFVAPEWLEFSSSHPRCYLATWWFFGGPIKYGGPGGPCCNGQCRE